MIGAILEKVVAACKTCPGIQAVVLGGSRATGTAGEQSDIDIGLYYQREILDYERLNQIAKQLDDAHRENLICREGQWGRWVNCGGWLTVGGVPVDLILRDWSRVVEVVRTSETGAFSCHYQTGHPHAYLDVMYRGELASCKILNAQDATVWTVKKQAEIYPFALKQALLDFFLFEADFSCMLAEKSMRSGDSAYLAGHFFRAISALNQVLFALNEHWLLNEKKAVFRVEGFTIHPYDYQKQVDGIFASVQTDPVLSVQRLTSLCQEVKSLVVQ